MPLTTEWRQKVGDHLLGKTDIGALADLWIGLSTSDPTDAGLFTGEPSGGSYGRINVTSLFGAVDENGIATNTAIVNFGVPSGDWGTLAYVFFASSETGTDADDMVAYEEIPNPRAAPSGSQAVRWSPGKLRIQLI